MIGEIDVRVLKNERRVTRMKPYRSIVLFLAVLILFSLTGCGGGGGGGTTAPSTDTTPPTVSSTNPTNNATGVAVNTAITATFSEAMDSSTISASTFTLSGGVTGTVTYDSATNTATLTPSASLLNSTTYTATITTGVKDSAGNAMAANYTWSFTTVAAAIVPKSGKWSGSNIQFNVSSDGSKITATGSSITSNGKSYALKLGPISDTDGLCSGSTTVTVYLSDISINNLNFEYSKYSGTNSTVKVTGNFTSTTNANGTYFIYYDSSYLGCLFIGEGNWSASPATSKNYGPPESDNSASAKYEYKYEPVTGELIEIREYTFE